ncbi:MAG: sigma-70 family RNA polymerase sigma factor [Acidobacteriota bacterium]
MDTSAQSDITKLLIDLSDGDQAALDKLIPLVYSELRQMAARYLRREAAPHTLQTTALVHEAYLKLVDQKKVRWQNRSHFFAIAAQAMRRILIDHARTRLSARRGGSEQKIALDDGAIDISEERASSLVALDEALERLAEIDPQKSRIVELRFFGGLSIEETAHALGIGTATVIRQWRVAKAWLYKEVTGEG